MGYQQPGYNQPPPGYDQYGQQVGFTPYGVANTSGQGEAAVIPPEIQGLNWGAFFLNWIWGIGNNVIIALLALIPFVGLIMPFVLLFKGNEWAWRNKQWESIEHFKQVQKKWAVWGLGLFIATMALTCVCVGIWFFALAASSSSSY